VGLNASEESDLVQFLLSLPNNGDKHDRDGS
jgi:hypothetical protein